MILVIGLSSFLRSLFGSAAAVALKNLALAINSWSFSGPWPDHAWRHGTGSSGSGCPGSGRAGGPASSSFNPRPSSPGTAKASSSIGGGGRAPTQSAARGSTPSFAT
jgi:hypothetical protein